MTELHELESGDWIWLWLDSENSYLIGRVVFLTDPFDQDDILVSVNIPSMNATFNINNQFYFKKADLPITHLLEKGYSKNHNVTENKNGLIETIYEQRGMLSVEEYVINSIIESAINFGKTDNKKQELENILKLGNKLKEKM